MGFGWFQATRQAVKYAALTPNWESDLGNQGIGGVGVGCSQLHRGAEVAADIGTFLLLTRRQDTLELMGGEHPLHAASTR